MIKVNLSGKGKKSSPYLINDIKDLMYLSKSPILWDKCLHFHLLSDVDANGCEFTPVGWESVQFRGIFEGNGHKIKNLTINLPQIHGVGLFGHIGTDAEIKSLTLLDVNICGKDGCGAIVGCNEGGTVMFCKVESGIIKSISKTEEAAIGTCVGANYNGGLVRNCIGKATLITADKRRLFN